MYEFEPVQIPAANSVTIDITSLTSEQRRIIQQTVKIFEAYNQSQKRGE